MVKRKLFKRALSRRALPFILSVAMVFQSMPATAMAEEPQAQEASAESAEADSAASSAGSGSHEDDFSKDSSGGSESRASEENAGASNEDVTNGENSNENASNGENSNENASNEDVSNEENSNENISDEAASNESTSNESASTEGVSSENASDESTLHESTSDEGAASESVSTESVSEEAKQPAAETPEETESESEGIKLNEEAAKVSILVDTDKLHSALQKKGLHYDEEDGTIFALYDAKTSNPFAAIQNGYCETDDESGEKIKDYFITVEQGSASNEALRDRLVYTWKNADGTALADGAVVPKNKGSYQLEIKLDKIDNVCEETVETLKFRIDARSVLVNYDEIDVISPGTTAEEAAKAIKEGYQLDLTDIDGDKTGEHLIKELDVVSCDVSIVRQRKEDGTQDNTKLIPADLIKSTEEYLIQMEITLTDQNYTLANTSSRLEVATGVRTEIKAASVQPDGTSFGWQYGDQPDLAALIKVINPYVVESDITTESEEETKVADAKLQYQWLDADEKELEETPGDGMKLPDKVKDAGTYYLRISYAGEPGRYIESEIDIQVVIDAMNVCIGGIETDTAEYVDGAAVSKVLQTITGYSVYKSGDADKKDIMGDDKYFWGVSNNGDADENTQSYEPVFAVRRGTHVKDKDGKDSVKWDTNYLDSNDKLVKTEKVGDEDITYEYRIEFSGKKAVYGEYDAPIDINRSQSNYLVDVTEDTLAANAFTIKLAVEGPAIDVTEMLIGDAASETDKGSLKNPMTKIYDGAPYFQTKNDYKKAKVTGRTDVASTELSYQWQKIRSYQEIPNEEEGKEPDFEVGNESNWDFENVEYTSAPTDAGRYRLEVSYTDKKSGAVSTAYVYYTIKKEDLLIQPESRVPAYYGETIADYLGYVRAALMLRPTDADGKEMISYTVTDFSKEGNGAPADADWLAYILGYLESEYGGNLSQEDSIGALIWKVERKITEGDKAGTWYELQDDDTFVEGVEYRLTVHADWQDIGNYVTDSYDEGIYVGDLKNYNNLYALDFKDEKVFDKQTNAYKTQARYADLQSAAITPAKSEGIEVEFEVDWDKITQTTKLYDGEVFTEALDAVKGAVKAYNKKTGAEINSEDITFGFEWTRESVEGTETHYVSEKNIVHAGTYYLNLIVPKSEIYAGEDVTFDKKNDKAFTITPRELTVTPVLKDEIKAGTEILSSDGAWGNAQNVRNIIDQLQVSEEMLLGDDKTCFFDKVRYYGDSEISYPWCMYDDTDKDNIQVPRLEVTDKTTGKPMTGYLRGDRAYNAKFSFGGKLGDYVLTQDQQVKHVFYGSDYTLKFDTVSFTTVRDQSSVSATTIGNPESGEYDSLKILDSVIREKDSFTHTITPREGIPYNKYYRDGKQVDSNHFSLEIQAPLEYTDVQGAENSVIYRNSIEKAGGFNVGLSVIDEDSPRHFIVRADFDAAQIAEAGGTSFEITWEEGFTETFKIEVPKNLLMEDLSKAVLPKSLAFNGAVTKMTVGEGQQLDLKITKVQMADTICVAYESSDEKVLTVSDSGSVTAIHTGKATVTAYAAYEDSTDNKIKPFLDAKGNYAKAAKLNITVSKLSEVKNIKLEAHDTYAYIDYKDMTDGYRREVYVLKGANIAAGEFESKIEAVKNGDYSAFDAHLFITAAERNVSNNAGKKFWAEIEGLQPNTQYTVYVRNVSALRKFPNGEQIDPSEFATASKPAKLTTTKSQQKELNGYFKTKEGEREPFVNGLTTVRNDEKSAVKAVYQYNNDEEEYERYYTVDVSAKSVKLDVEAMYYQKYQEGIDYADQWDYIWYPLSLTKELQKDYINPKLTYYVTNWISADEDDYGAAYWTKRGYVYADGHYFLPTTTKAAIDKNGKISLKGSGTIKVIAYDAEQDIMSIPIELRITTNVDGLAGKAIKMKVGSRIYLSDYLTYKQKNIKLSQYNDGDKDLVVTLEDPDGAFELKPSVYDGEVYDGALRISDYQIIAKRPTTRPLELKVSDKTVTKNGGSEITIKLSASALDPVKSLKAYDVYDTQGSIRFDYAGRMDNSNLQFRIEVKDQSGKILKNQLVDSSNEWREFSYRNEAFYKALYNHDYKVYNEYWEDWEYSNGFREYNAKKNIYTYYYDLTNLEGLKLTRLSNYTVSVTAVYDGYDAKTATTKIKTTNIPASKTNAAEYDDNGKDKNNDGGETVVVYKNKNNTNTLFLDTYPLLKSGNSYTLDFTGGDKNARNMKTDTLTWKSSNTKVATVKANSGTFTAALKAVKKGTTQITVTSKITKKVIARWTVFVTAVGEADGYFGDNIDQNIDADWDNELNADKLGADLLTLNNSMSFTLANGEKKWVAFKAPSDGRYWVNIVSEEGSFIAYDSDSRPLGSLGSNFSGEEMEKGETVYFLLTVTNAKTKKQIVTIKATGTPYTTLTTAADGVKVRGDSIVVFKAPEENVYTFTAVDKNGKEASVWNGYPNTIVLEKNAKKRLTVFGQDEYTIKVTPAEQLTDNTKLELKKGETKYYKFTPDETNEYTLYTAEASEQIQSATIYTAYYENLNSVEDAQTKPSSDTDTNPKNVGFETKKLEKGDVRYLSFTAGNQDTTAVFKAEKAEKTGVAFTIAKAGGEKTVVYNVDKDGEYNFTATGTDVTITKVEVSGVSKTDNNTTASYQTSLKKGDYVKLTVSAKNADTSVTVNCTFVEPVQIQAGASVAVAVISGLEKKVEFTASENGWYAFTFDKDTVKVSYTEGTVRAVSTDYQSGTELYVKKGGTRTFTVSTTETTEQTVTVTAAKNSSVKLTNMTEPVTLTKGKTYRYYWTAAQEGLYEFDFTVTGADLTCSTDEAGENTAEYISGYYEKGKTFYVTVNVSDSADGSFKAVIVNQKDAAELKADTDNTVTVGAKASKWVSFTSKQAVKVRYQYSKADGDGFNFYENTGLDDSGTANISFTEDKILRPGEKVYYKIENQNAEEKTVKLRIDTIKPTEVGTAAGTGVLSGTANIKAGANGWYHFHAANAGRYSIFVNSKADGNTVGIANYQVYENLTESALDTDSIQFIKAGKDIYIKVPNDSAQDTDITVTVTDMAAAGVTLELGNAKELQLKQGVTQYLVYNVTETARYTLTSVASDNKEYPLDVIYYVDKEKGVEETTPVSAVYWTAGSSIVFEVLPTADATVKVTLAKENIIELTDEAAQQTISAGQTLYFRSKTDAKDVRYFIETSETAEGLTLNYVSVTGGISWNNGYTDFVAAPKQEEVIFGLTAVSTFEGTKTFKMKRGIVTPAAVKAGTPAESAELAAYHKTYYTFTPEKAGRYSIKAGGVSVSECRNGITGRFSEIHVPDDFIVTDAMVGKEVIYSLYHADTAAKKLNFSITETTAEELVSDTPYTVDITKVELNESVWLHFKAPADGRYTVAISNANIASAMYCYEALDQNQYTTVRYYGTEYCMKAGEEYYFPVSYSEKPEENFTISVSAITDSSAEAVSVSETAKEFDMKAGEVKWLKFTPEQTANYKFELKNVQFGYILQYDSIASESMKYLYNNSTIACVAGKTIYFKLTAASSLPEGNKPSIKITSKEMQTLTEGENTISQIAENENYKYAYFAPSEKAVYGFELTDSTECEVHISREGNFSSYSMLYEGTEPSSFVLDKTQPAYIRIKASGNDKESASATVRITKTVAIGEISMGGAVDVTLTQDSSIAFYYFTAPEDGIYIFDTDQEMIYVYLDNSIESDMLNPGNYKIETTRSSAIGLKKGESKYIRIAENNLDSAGHTFTLTCKKAAETSFTGAKTIKLNLKKDNPVYVRWFVGEKGNYRLGFRVNDDSGVDFKYYKNNNLSSYPNSYWNNTSRMGYWDQYEDNSENSRGLILEANEAAVEVEVYAQIVPRSLATGGTEKVVLDSDKRYEEFNFSAEAEKMYIFQTRGAENSRMNITVTDTSSNTAVTPDRTYYQDNDCYRVYTFENSGEYKLRVSPVNGNSYGDTFEISAYYYQQWIGFKLYNREDDFSTSWDVEKNGEIWLQFNVEESGRYGFGADDRTVVNLYRFDNGNLELLGVKESGSSSKIWSALGVGDVIYAQTWYGYSHNDSSYSVNVTCNLSQQGAQNWTFYGSQTESTPISVNQGYERAVPLNIDNLSSTAKYAFRIESSYDSENIETAMYQTSKDENGIETRELIAEGYNFTCEINPNNSYELRISNYGNSYWYGSIYAEKAYPYEEYELTLDNNAQKVTVKDGSEARFYFTVPEDGTYMLYGTSDSYCDNYAELWVNDEKRTSTGYGGQNGQFSISAQLSAGDKVELRTYMQNHAIADGTYTVHIENVPEDYQSMDQMYMSSTSLSANISSLSAGETKKYRFIAPTLSAEDGDTAEHYIFYSEISTSTDETVMNLTATVQLASEVSTFAMGDSQKDEKGNFYNVVELTSGRPYILSITNNGKTNVNSGNIYAYRYTEANGGEPIRIGGMNEQNEALVVNSAAGEETWVSYTVEEDGIYTFTVSDADQNGYMYLYSLEYSQLTKVPDYNNYRYFSNNSGGKFESINLKKGENILLRVYQISHQALSCNVQAKWEVWDITSVEEGSNTKEVATDSSETEGKVWLNFDETIEAGTYKITSQNTYSTTLKLYKNGQEVSNPESTDQQSGTAITFEYKPDEKDVYQLGITTTSSSSITLTITKAETAETPGDGDNENGGTDSDTDAGENGGTTGNNDSSTNG